MPQRTSRHEHEVETHTGQEMPMIRASSGADITVVRDVINEAAEVYRGVIPPDCWHDPYMSEDSLATEIAAGVRFSVWDEGGEILGVMGLQHVRDVTLIRHAYVRSGSQGRGIGSALLSALTSQTASRLYVGTWADARWAVRFYERHGFELVPGHEKERPSTRSHANGNR